MNTQAAKAQQAKMLSSKKKDGAVSPEEAGSTLPSPNTAQLHVSKCQFGLEPLQCFKLFRFETEKSLYLLNPEALCVSGPGLRQRGRGGGSVMMGSSILGSREGKNQKIKFNRNII